MAVVPLVINGVTMPAPQDVVSDMLKNATYTDDATGSTHVDLLSQKRWKQITWGPLTIAEMSLIQTQLHAGPYVQLTALDHITGASRTMTAIVSKSPAPLYNETLGLYASLSVEFTETGVTYVPPTNDESDATATAATMLDGVIAYVDNVRTVGTMPDREGDNACSSSSVDGTTLKLVAPTGFYDGTDTVTITDADFVASNIADGVTIFGITGTATAGEPVTHATYNPASLLNVVIPAPTYP